MRHKKSKQLAFKYWDHDVHLSVPKRATDFEYLNVKYALENCTWMKTNSAALLAAASVLSEQVVLNRGPTRNSIKKAKQRGRPWWVLRANAAAKLASASSAPQSDDAIRIILPEKQSSANISRSWREETNANILHQER